MILVFGQSGQVARELARLAPKATFLGRTESDLADPEACAAAIRDYAPEAVINAAAYTAVDKAESEEDLATTINGNAPTAMAKACAARDIPFLHLSTDYVFDGAGTRPWGPDDPTAPVNAYGRSKRAGEIGIAASGAVHAILRTSWVFSAHGSNFVKTMLRLGRTRDRVAVVSDQIGGPTPAAAIAAACLTIAKALGEDPGKSGTYHFAGAPDVSWADFARAIFTSAKQEVVVDDIATSAYPTPAPRPRNSRLDCSGLAAFDLHRPDWERALATVVNELESHP